MELDNNVNYIISGLERSGTSMLMQILKNGGIPTSYDDSRPADESNPQGYFELEGGKIINRLIEGKFPFDKFKGTFIKITAYGIKFLPVGRYKIIFSERNVDEILFSMEKMAKVSDDNREETREIFLKLNKMIKEILINREDCEVIFVNYNEILKSPEQEINKISNFLGGEGMNQEAMINTIDKALYRQRQ